MAHAMGWSTPQGNRRCFNAVDGPKPQKFKSMELQRTVDPLFGFSGVSKQYGGNTIFKPDPLCTQKKAHWDTHKHLL